MGTEAKGWSERPHGTDMRAFRNAPFRRKLVALTSLVSILVAIVACAALIVGHALTFRGDLARDLSSLARVIGDSCSAALLFDDRESAQETLASLNAMPQIRSAVLHDAGGKQMARSEGRPAGGTVTGRLCVWR